MGNCARGAAKKFSEFATLTMKLTIAPGGKLTGKFSLIEACLACWDRTGRVLWMTSKLLSAARKVENIHREGDWNVAFEGSFGKAA